MRPGRQEVPEGLRVPAPVGVSPTDPTPERGLDLATVGTGRHTEEALGAGVVHHPTVGRPCRTGQGHGVRGCRDPGKEGRVTSADPGSQDRVGADVLVRARRGDEAAFRSLYAAYSPAVHTVALRVLGDTRDAEEATQDTFVAAWRHLDGFRGDSAVTTWLHRICVNRCLSISRRRRPVTTSAEVLELHPDPQPGPAQTTEVRHRLAAARDALDLLPPSARLVLVLRDVADLSYGEVADVLGISLTAARSRIHRARTALLDLLDDEDPSTATEVRRGA